MAEGRPKLVLKPRDEEAAKKADADRQQKSSNNPFGAAKPREAVLASRTGKTEQEILQEAVRHERLRLRLNSQQVEEKEALEALVTEMKEQIDKEEDESRRKALQTLLEEREGAVDALMDKFAHLALDAAARGEFQRPSERRAQQEVEAAAGGSRYGGSGGRGGGYGEGGRGRGDGGYGGGRGGGRGYGYSDRQYNPRDAPEARQDGEGGGYRSGGYGGGRGGRSDYNDRRYGQGNDGYSGGAGAAGGSDRDFWDSGRADPAPRGGRTGGPGGNGSRYDDDYLPGMPGSGTGSGANQGKFEVDFRSLAQDRF